MLLKIFLVLLNFGFAKNGYSTSSKGMHEPKLNFAQFNLVSGCNIYSVDGTLLRQFTGSICWFLDDGSFISGNSARLARVRSDRSIAWEIPGEFHHQINWTADKKNILALSSQFIDIDGASTRIDTFKKISLDGKVLAQIDSKTVLEQLKVKRLYEPFDWAASKTGALFEVSHFNSFYEISNLSVKSKYFENGDFIINSLFLGVFILSSDLKTAKSFYIFETAADHLVHDVQVTSDGQLLYLNNYRNQPENSKISASSAIELFDPKSMKTTYSYTSSPPEAFYSRAAGGVQQVDQDHYLISLVTGQFFLLNHRTKKVIISGLLSDKRSIDKYPFIQQIKMENLKNFLMKW